MLIVGLLPLILMGGISLTEVEESVRRSTHDALTTIATQTGTEVLRTVREGYRNVLLLAQNPVIISTTASRREQYEELRKSQELYPIFKDLAVLTEDGQIRASVFYSFRGYWKMTTWFQRAIKGETVVSAVHADLYPFDVVITVATPVRADDERIIGVLVGQLDMRSVLEIIGSVSAGNDSEILVVDEKGVVVAAPDSDSLLEPVKYDPIRAAVRNRERGISLFEWDNDAKVAVCVPIEENTDSHFLDWTAVIVRSQREAYASLYRARAALILAGVASFFIVCVISMFLSGQISGRVRKLLAATHRLGKSDFSGKVEAGGKDEIGELAEAFNQANEQLAASQQRNREAEEALRETEKRYRHLFTRLNDAAVVADLDTGVILEANEQAEVLLGRTRDEIIGIDQSELYPHDQSGAYREMFTALGGGGRISDYESTIVKKDRSTVPVMISASAISLSGKEVILALFRDISVIKQAEEEKKSLEDRLRRAQKMEAIGTLAGGVAHDLNNILSGLVTYPELLLMEIPEDSPLRKPISIIQQAGRRAAAIVSDLLTLARRGVAVREVINLNDSIVEYLKSPEYEKLKSFHPHVCVETSLDETLHNIEGSPVHQAKTIMNLVSNAAEAMPDGGTIFISTENRSVDKPLKGYERIPPGEYVVLTVLDRGIGIPAADVERIFEPFYTKKVLGRSGTGLGMSVVWGTVKDHNGYIDVQSREGRGTVCTLYFPVTRKEAVKNPAVVSPETYRGQGESILVIDDVAEQREVASLILKGLGYEVACAASGEEAVEYLQGGSADLLILDMIMEPGIDGLETYKRILELHPGQKAIIASGFSETERVREAEVLGAGAYLKKPYTREEIGLRVRAELDK